VHGRFLGKSDIHLCYVEIWQLVQWTLPAPLAGEFFCRSFGRGLP
jgi:hypothetical protein